MGTATAPLTIQERVAVASDLVDWITEAGGEVKSLDVNGILANITLRVAGNEAGVDALADLLALRPDETPTYGNYQRDGRIRGLTVAVWSGRSKPVCRCGQRCDHEQVPA